MQSAQAQESNPRNLLSALIKSISTTPNPQSPPNDKSLFLTLYALFEKELLPALDCLDRGLITHLKLTGGESGSTIQQQELYLVCSAQQHHTRHGPSQNNIYYEVRLESWNCSCPAFVFSAFPVSATSSSSMVDITSAFDTAATKDENTCLKEPFPFGGLTRARDMPPVCKHILACILVKHCAGFEGFVEEKEVSKEELAGWAAGWGD